MSNELEKIYFSFLENSIPTQWVAVSYASIKSLGSWVKDLKLRCEFIEVLQLLKIPLTYFQLKIIFLFRIA